MSKFKIIKMHVFSAGDENKPKLVSDYRIIVTEKFGYGYSDLYESPCDIDSVIDFQREALETGRNRSAHSLYEENAERLNARMNAKTVELCCSHYIHYYESERISREIRAFIDRIRESL